MRRGSPADGSTGPSTIGFDTCTEISTTTIPTPGTTITGGAIGEREHARRRNEIREARQRELQVVHHAPSEFG